MRGVTGETVLGRYRLEALIAEGGFGQVWKARQIALNRPVAVKFLRPLRREDESLRERFRREALLLANLVHPAVVVCHDFGEDDDGDLVLVMEYLEGRTLLDLFREGRLLGLRRVVTWVSQAADGLWEAHARGIVHRDVKPSNLFLVNPGGQREHLKVIDFGILRADPRAHPGLGPLTATGMVVGTPEYLPPEVVLGAVTDPRGDQYALALVAFEMLTMRRAFPPWEDQGMMARIWGRPEGMDLADGGRVVPPAVREVLWRALSPAPDERYPTIRDFGQALREAAGMGPSPEDRPTVIRRVEESLAAGPEEETRTEVTLPEIPERGAGRGGRRWRIALAAALVIAVAGGWALSIAHREGEAGNSLETRVMGDPRPAGQDEGLGDASGAPRPGGVGPGGEGETPVGGEFLSGTAGGLAEPGPLAARPEEVGAGPERPRPGARSRPSARGRVEVAPARLSLNAIPWAEVFLDGQPLGSTPIRDLEVPAGEHRVGFVHPSLGRTERVIRLEAGERRNLVVEMVEGEGPGPIGL